MIMMVYSWKQYGNNFNSWDEGLFQDASRPRDSDKFKLRPWLQSDKRKQREVNKDITVVAAQLSWRGDTTIGSINNDGFFIPNLQQQAKKGNPWCIINNDWNIEITEDGTYILQASCQFKFSSSPNVNVVEIVDLLRLVDWERRAITRSQWRAALTDDLQVATFVWWYNKGNVFNVRAGHNLNAQVYLYAVMNVQRLA